MPETSGIGQRSLSKPTRLFAGSQEAQNLNLATESKVTVTGLL
jgi:hypothetical protein